MSSNRRNAKREAKLAKETPKKGLEERKKHEKSYHIDEPQEIDISNENNFLS
jgi:hypothetical protein